MDFKCFVYPGWEPRIRAASTKRAWMDQAPESFPYRCLPLAIANSHGWEILSPCGFEVEWNGGPAPEDVVVRPDRGARDSDLPVALFGQATFTLHIQGLFRTPPGWNLYVNGPPNRAKDGASPLAGIIETDWSPYSFTMNWQLTRPGLVVRFEENEPIAHLFPIERRMIEAIEPRLLPIDDEPGLRASFDAWSQSRDAFQQRMRDDPPASPSEKWQKLYYRGLTPDGQCPIGDHQAKLRVREFSNAAVAEPTQHAPRPAPPPAPSDSSSDWKIAEYEWLFETQARQRALSDAAGGILRCEGLSEAEFLEHFYAPGRPVILCGAIESWPARQKWTADHLRRRIGGTMIECQVGPNNARFEPEKARHPRRMPFDQFIELVLTGAGHDVWLTSHSAVENAAALEPLEADLGRIDAILDHDAGASGTISIGPEGMFTPLHYDLTNNLFVQITGRRHLIVASPAETAKLYNERHVFSDVGDLADPSLDLATYPRLHDIRTLDLVLEPGEALFLPVGWWHQMRALDFSVSMTCTNFRWPNEGERGHPTRR